MTDSAYDALEANSCQYKVVYSDDSDVTQFRKDMNEQYKIDSYLAKDNNQRITMVDDQAMMFLIMALYFLFYTAAYYSCTYSYYNRQKDKAGTENDWYTVSTWLHKDSLCGIIVCLQ